MYLSIWVRSGNYSSQPFECPDFGRAPGGVSLTFQDRSRFRVVDDPVGYADAVVRLLENPSLRRLMGERARQLFERSYSSATVTPHVLDVYRTIEHDVMEERTQ